MTTRTRDPLLTVLAVLMGLLAVSNFMKPLAQTMQPESDAGFVFLGGAVIALWPDAREERRLTARYQGALARA